MYKVALYHRKISSLTFAFCDLPPTISERFKYQRRNKYYHGYEDIHSTISIMAAMKKNKANKNTTGTIALNKKARHDYFLEDKFEAGMELQGWEIKSIRSGKVNISDCYVIIQNAEAYLVGCRITPLNQASTHVVCEPERARKLLLNKRELDRLMGARDRQGYSIVATAMYWKKCWVKLEIHLAKGKHERDKRDSIKDKDWQRQKERMMKHSV